ncbi:MAG: NHLP bacteriocin system secretion protein, partial [Acidobacteriota bacterium]
QLRERQASLEESVQVISPDGGRVLELMVDRGDVVSPGTPMLSMEVESEDLMAVVFVPAELGKQVSPGMEARITPSTVKAEEYGFINGEVQWVAKFPSTSRGMRRLLANDDLVTKLMQQGPPIQVDVRLERDDSTPTGFRWSSSTGPNVEISSGSLAGGAVIVRETRPISLVIPTVRKTLGI